MRQKLKERMKVLKDTEQAKISPYSTLTTTLPEIRTNKKGYFPDELIE
jgi:hypothetical protein